MWQISPLAAIALVIRLFTNSATTCLTASDAARRDYRLDAPVFTVAAALPLLRLTPPILGDSMLTVGHFALPERGWQCCWQLWRRYSSSIPRTRSNAAHGYPKLRRDSVNIRTANPLSCGANHKTNPHRPSGGRSCAPPRTDRVRRSITVAANLHLTEANHICSISSQAIAPRKEEA